MQAGAKELLTGAVWLGEDQKVPFSLSGEARDNVVGGEIRLGEASFEITRVSTMGLIGASRWHAGEDPSEPAYGEFVTFSSSFSEETAVGQPWVAARKYVNCDVAYNSFIAIYRVDGIDAVKALGPVPYRVVTNDIDASDESTVYCFISTASL